jgi:hypothetical protein
MKLEDLIYDIKHMLMALSETTTVLDGDIIDKLAKYRMAYIVRYFAKNQRILEEWYQYVDNFVSEDWHAITLETTPITYITGGKVKIPKVISLTNGIHLRLYTETHGARLYPVEFEQFMAMIELTDNRTNQFKLYSHRNDTIYTYKKNDFTLYAILQEPTLGKIDNVSNLVSHTNLVEGVLYIIVSGGSITYTNPSGAEKTFSAGDTFLGTTLNDWVDNDLLNPAVINTVGTTSYDHKYFDEYPLDGAGAQEVILEILTKDYKIRSGAISDVLQDDQDQFKILTSRT